MKFSKIFFSFLFLFSLISFPVLAMGDDPADDPADQAQVDLPKDSEITEKDSEITDELLEGMNSVLFEQVLDQDFSSLENKKLALLKKYELLGEYDSIKSDIESERYKPFIQAKIKRLQSLIKWQKMAHAKLEILFASNDYYLSIDEYKTVKLKLLYEILDRINKGHIRVDNGSITNCVKKCLSSKPSSQLSTLLKIDLYGLWSDFYQKYEKLIMQYKENKKNLTMLKGEFEDSLEELLKFLIKQKNILSNKDFDQGLKRILKKFWGKLDDQKDQSKNSIKLFDLFISKLISIKSEIECAQDWSDKFLNLKKDDKRVIMIKNLVLLQDEDFKKFGKVVYGNQYQDLVTEYLNSDKISENFVFQLLQFRFELERLKAKKEPTGLIYAAFGFGIYKKDTKLIYYLLKNMIAILEDIGIAIRKENEGVISKGEQFVEKVINGEIKVPEKLKNIIWSFIQAAVG